jgi:hypothetical protein
MFKHNVTGQEFKKDEKRQLVADGNFFVVHVHNNYRKQVKMQWLQYLNRINADNLNNTRCEVGRNFWNITSFGTLTEDAVFKIHT